MHFCNGRTLFPLPSYKYTRLARTPVEHGRFRESHNVDTSYEWNCSNRIAMADSFSRDRLPLLDWLPRGVRNHIVAMSGEFIGTFLFLFFAFAGTQVAKTTNKQTQTQATATTTVDQGPNPAQLLYVSLCFGFSLAVNAWVFFRISGGLFNPALVLQRRDCNAPANGSQGHSWNVPNRSYVVASWFPHCHFPNSWRHFKCGHCERPVPRPAGDTNSPRRWNEGSARSLHRDVPHRPAGICHLYAGSRETQGYPYCAYRHRPLAVHRRTYGYCRHCRWLESVRLGVHRRLSYRWLGQPCAHPWAVYHPPLILPIPLGRAFNPGHTTPIADEARFTGWVQSLAHYWPRHSINSLRCWSTRRSILGRTQTNLFLLRQASLLTTRKQAVKATNRVRGQALRLGISNLQPRLEPASLKGHVIYLGWLCEVAH